MKSQSSIQGEIDYEYLEHALIGGVLSSEECWETLRDYIDPSHFTIKYLGDLWGHIATTVESINYAGVDDNYIADCYIATSIRRRQHVTKEWVLNTIKLCREASCKKVEAIAVATHIKQNTRKGYINRVLEQAIAASPIESNNALAEVARVLNETNEAEFIEGIANPQQAFEKWKLAANEDFGDAGIWTGWPTLDRGLKRPLARGEVISLAARAGVGKTHGAASIVRSALARNITAGALFISCEMPLEEITERFIAQALNVDSENLRLEAVGGEINYGQVIAADPTFQRIRFYDRDITIQQLPSIITRSSKSGIVPRLVVIDYIGLIKWDGNKGALGYEKASEIARELKSVAKKTGTTIIACAQLNRESGDGTSRPSLHHIRDSGAIEEASDRVFGMWKDTTHVFCEILKNRHGPTGAVSKLSYTAGYELVEDLSSAIASAKKDS